MDLTVDIMTRPASSTGSLQDFMDGDSTRNCHSLKDTAVSSPQRITLAGDFEGLPTTLSKTPQLIPGAR